MLPFRRAPVTKLLLLTIFVVFIAEWVLGAIHIDWSARDLFSMIGGTTDDEKLVEMGAIVPGMLASHEYWRAVTAIFLHGGLLHWAVNSWALYQLGFLFESLFGSTRFAVTFFVTGIIASIASSLSMHMSVGASGAIFGILGAFIFSLKGHPEWRNQPWTQSLIRQLVFWALVNIALGFSIKGIDNVAHLAGLGSGLLMGLIPHRVPPSPPGEAVIDVTPQHYGSE